VKWIQMVQDTTQYRSWTR